MIEPRVQSYPTSQACSRSVLIVDDDRAFREALREALRAFGFDVTAAAAGPTALEAARRAPDFAIVDTCPTHTAPHDMLSELVPLAPNAKIVALARNGSIASAIRAYRRGASDYLTKPIRADAIAEALARLDGGPAPEGRTLDATPSLARATWEHLQRVLVDADGNISETARRLGIARRTLQLKLKKDPPRA